MLCIIFYALYSMHHILIDLFYAMLSRYFELTLKLVGHQPIHRQTDRRTDIVRYSAAIAAKK